MTQQNLSIKPYWDDFSADAGFHQILFKPAYSVQARELTQIQSILRDQISKFGNHIFKHGSVVLPGNINSDQNICYVKLLSTAVDVTTLVGKEVTGTSGLRGLIRAGIGAVDADPATLYVSYFNTGTAGEVVFGASEVLSVNGYANMTTVASAATGGASMAFITKGVFFVNGSFVGVDSQSLVIGKYTSTPSCHVMLKIEETIVNSDTDITLLDPAQDSYNFAAPGADRLKLSLSMVTQPLGAVLSSDYIELMRFNVGVLEESLRYPKYNELEKSLARRTYEESGNYVTSGLKLSTREHLKSTFNGGRYDAPTGDASKFIYSVSPGKAYIKGFENEVLSSVELIVDKARTTAYSTANIVPNYGQYIRVSDLVGLPDFLNRETVNLNDAFSGGAVIGTCKVSAIDYHESNTTDSNAIFKLFVFDVVMDVGKDVTMIGNITFTGGSFKVVHRYDIVTNNAIPFTLAETASVGSGGTRTSTVHKYFSGSGEFYAHKNGTATVPVVGDVIVGQTSGASARCLSYEVLSNNTDKTLLLPLPKKAVSSVVAASGIDISYKIYYTTTVTCSGGTASFSVTGMTIDPKEQGNFLAVSAAGVHPLSAATVSPDGLTVSFAGITPASATLKVVCAATKIAGQGAAKTKIIATANETGLTPGTIVQLLQADGVRLNSVVSTVDGDVTDRFVIDGGQSDFAYLRSTLKLTGTLPTGTLTVNYDYFIHNAGSGDYFSVNSYIGSNLSDYFSSVLLQYKAKATGDLYDLRNCLDFRPRVGTDGTFTGTGASVSRVIQIDSRLTTSLQHYIGRTDAIIMDKDGKLSVVQGTPSENPLTPIVSPDVILLGTASVPAYTYSVADIKVVPKNNKAYTMSDIGGIESRVKNLEDYVTLTALEQDTVNYDIIDAGTGLSRYKSGFLIDTFNDPDIISNVYDTHFRVAYSSGEIIPSFEVFESELEIVTNYCQVTGDVITLPYTEVVVIRQPLSSRVTNVNPFSVFSWKGNMTLTPSSDTWTDTTNLPVVRTSSTEVIVETVNIGSWGTGTWNWVQIGPGDVTEWGGSFIEVAPRPWSDDGIQST